MIVFYTEHRLDPILYYKYAIICYFNKYVYTSEILLTNNAYCKYSHVFKVFVKYCQAMVRCIERYGIDDNIK